MKSLTIGAGGNIIQHIERDQNDPRVWDVANSKILNVQLIDARTFRLVTGLQLPETPITPDMYRRLGLPFYQLWRDEAKEAGVAGSWGPIMGAKAVASKNMKQKNVPAFKSDGFEWSVYGETGNLGFLKSGDGAKMDEDEDEVGEGSPSAAEFTESSFDFPVVMLDVDDTFPVFKSAMESLDG